MKLCFISPIANLEDVSNEGDILFCLARQAKEFPLYKDFFIKSNKPILFDNSIHENERISDEEFVKLAIEMGVDEIIIPDCMKDGEETLKLAKEFLNKYHTKLKQHNIKTVGVIQGKTMDEITKCFSYLNNDFRVDYLALPFDLVPYDFVEERNLNQMMNRLLILQTLSSGYKIKKDIHALGLNLLLEVKLLDAFPRIRSCDSKILTRLALCNIKLDEENWQFAIKPTRKMDFYDELTPDQIKLNKENIKFLREQLMKTK
jgi:hypothetical protein